MIFLTMEHRAKDKDGVSRRRDAGKNAFTEAAGLPRVYLISARFCIIGMSSFSYFHPAALVVPGEDHFSCFGLLHCKQTSFPCSKWTNLLP